MGGKADALTSCHPGEELVSGMRTSDEKSHQDRSRHLSAKKAQILSGLFFLLFFVDILSMPYFQHKDNKLIFYNLIDNTIITLSNPINIFFSL